MKKIFILLLLPFLCMANDDDEVLKDLKNKQSKARKALEVLDVAKAKKNALMAISIIEKHHLSNRDLADIYIIAGVLDLTIEDGSKAKGYFKKALSLDPTIMIPDNFSSDNVEKLFLDAKEELRKSSYKISCEYPNKHDLSKDLLLNINVFPIPESGYDVILFYSNNEKSLYKSVFIKKKGKAYVAKIDSNKLKTGKLKFYIKLMNHLMIPLADYGTDKKPISIDIVSKNAKKTIVKKKKHIPHVGFSLNVGYGIFGFTGGGTPKFSLEHVRVTSGAVESSLMYGTEFNFFINPKLVLDFELRLQHLDNDFFKTWATYLKAKYLLFEHNSSRIFLGGGLGYGKLGYKVDISNVDVKQPKDFLISEFFHFDFLFQYIYMISDNFGFLTSLSTRFVVPDISITEDLTLGIYLEF